MRIRQTRTRWRSPLREANPTLCKLRSRKSRYPHLGPERPTLRHLVDWVSASRAQMRHDKANLVVFQLRHDLWHDLREAPHIHKWERHLAPRYLRSSGDENATRPTVGVHFTPSVMMRRSTYGTALPNGGLHSQGGLDCTSLGVHAMEK